MTSQTELTSLLGSVVKLIGHQSWRIGTKTINFWAQEPITEKIGLKKTIFRVTSYIIDQISFILLRSPVAVKLFV